MLSHEHQAEWLEIYRELFIAVRLQLMETEKPFGR